MLTQEALPTAADFHWLLQHCGFTVYEMVAGVNPLNLEADDVEAYSRLLRHALSNKPPAEIIEEDFELEEEASEEEEAAPVEVVEERDADGLVPGSNQAVLLTLVRTTPGMRTPAYADAYVKAGGNRPSTNSMLNSLRKKGLIRSHKKGKGSVYRWFPAK